MEREIINFFTEDGHEILTQEAVPVEHKDIGSDHVRQTIDDMLDTLRSQGPEGVGIAANQIVGAISQSLSLMCGRPRMLKPSHFGSWQLTPRSLNIAVNPRRARIQKAA